MELAFLIGSQTLLVIQNNWASNLRNLLEPKVRSDNITIILYIIYKI